MATRFAIGLFSLLSLSLLVGCLSGGSDQFPDVKLDGAEIATQIFTEYDQDGNGELSQAELKKNGGLFAMFDADKFQPEVLLDSDRSGAVSEQELADKLNGCFAHKRGAFTCQVFYKNRPLPGATVTLVPESFMGELGSASGETDAEGHCGVSNEDGHIGAKPGIYRVEITHPDVKLPARYNTESEIAVAIDTTNPYAKSPEFKLR